MAPGVGGLSGPADVIFCPLVSGDINGDGRADSGDVEPFVDALLGLPQLPIHLSRSDLNNSGTADGADIMAFIDLVFCQ